MPKFYFHIRDTHGVIPDEEGSHCGMLLAALAEAEASARDLIKQGLDRRDMVLDAVIEVHDETGRRLAELPVREVLENPQQPRFRTFPPP